MSISRVKRRVIAVSLSCFVWLCACETIDAPLPDAAVAPTPVPLPSDPTLACDGAVDGTACGEPGRGWHCVFNVCARNVCGDTVLADEEQCDDGNDVTGDGCSRRCRLEVAGTCGNGVVDGDEECDDDNAINDDLCSNACTLNVCRNGRVDPGEECDDGNRVHFDDRHDGDMGDDVCSNACQAVICGNDRVDPGEECEDQNEIDDDQCANTCTENVCGNQRLDPGETCDGDIVDGLACNDTCTGRGVDQCVVCMSERCAETYSYDVFTSCRVEVIPEQVSNPTRDFVLKCTAFDECVRRTGCYDASIGILPCYCGDGVDPAACQAGTEVRGPCIPEATAATVCAPNDSSCVVSLLPDLTLPSGFAFYLAHCRYEECAEACGF